MLVLVNLICTYICGSGHLTRVAPSFQLPACSIRVVEGRQVHDPGSKSLREEETVGKQPLPLQSSEET